MARAKLFTLPFALITAGAFGYFMAYAMGIPTLPLFVRDELGGGKVAVGLVVGAFSITALVCRPFAGRLADARGRRIPIVGGASFFAVSIFGLMLTTSIPIAFALRLLSGIGEALFFVGAVAAISDMAPPERRGEAISLFSVSLYAGIAIGPSFGEAINDARGFDDVWFVAGALAISAAILGLTTRDQRAPHFPDVERSTTRRILHPAGVVPGAVMFTSVFGFAGYMAFLALYAEELGMSGTRSILMVYGAILVAIRLFGARIPDRLGVERIGLIGLSASTGGLVTIGILHSVTGLWIGSMIFGVGQALAFPAYMALAASSAPPAERGAAVGTTTAFIDLGFGVGPVTLGVVAAAFGTRTTFLVSAGVAVCGIVAQLALRRARIASTESATPASSGDDHVRAQGS